MIYYHSDLLPAFEVRDKKTVNNPIEASILAKVVNFIPSQLLVFSPYNHCNFISMTEISLLDFKVTKELVDNGIKGHDIGIITPYNSQVKLIQDAISTNSVEIHTIDKYQVT